MQSNSKNIIIVAAVLGALAVSIGAFGAHGLRPLLMEHGRVETFETAVKYQFYHTLALLFIGLLYDKFPMKQLTWAAYAMFVGVLIFSGSLYILCVTNVNMLGAITPIGGVFLIVGWIMLLLAAVKSKN